MNKKQIVIIATIISILAYGGFKELTKPTVEDLLKWDAEQAKQDCSYLKHIKTYDNYGLQIALNSELNSDKGYLDGAFYDYRQENMLEVSNNYQENHYLADLLYDFCIDNNSIDN